MLSKSLVRDDLRFSVCYSVTNVLSPLRTPLLPKGAPVSYFILSMRGFLSIHTNVFLVVNQPNEKHNEVIETPNEKEENMLSFFLVEIHNSFLNE